MMFNIYNNQLTYLADLAKSRGYYMAARGYKFYLRMLKVSLTEREDKIHFPKRPCNVLFILLTLMKCQKNWLHT